jgi:hypothetical protein
MQHSIDSCLAQLQVKTKAQEFSFKLNLFTLIANMPDTRYLGRERTLAAEKNTKYIGSASICIENLHFQSGENRANVKRLKQLFQKTGYDRIDIHNHVPAVIDENTLYGALDLSGISLRELGLDTTGSYAKLEFSPTFRLECLHGVDRVHAASSLLPYGDKRWIVDLYHDGIFILLPC